MARELKFKAWSKRDSAWYMDGSAFDLNYSGRYGDFYFDNDHPADMRGADLVWCQFSGLKDSEGREIYEGDILEVEVEQTIGPNWKNKAVIEWCDDGYWQLDFPTLGQSMIVAEAVEMKVIGNELEHPELLGTTTG